MYLFGFILLNIFLLRMIQSTAGKEVMVLIFDYNGPIHQVNTSDGTHSVVYRDEAGVENVAYDPVLEHIYWSNLANDQILRVNLDGRNVTKVASVRQCQGMVVDHFSRFLFYSDDTTKVITKLSLTETRDSSVIARISSPNRPHDLTADVDKKKLYWTVLGHTPQIETSDYNGGHRERLLQAGRVPTALALDSTGGILFWLDEHKDNNELMALNLVNRSTSTVPYGTQGNLYDIDILNTTLYIIDRTQSSVFLTLPETGGTPQKIPITAGMNQYRHIKVFSYPYECPAGMYGAECDLSCGHCEDGQSCSRRTGQCPSGCEPGWRKGTCSEECQAGTYGSGCTGMCGNCRNGNPCSKIDGRCPDGCADGWTGVKCDEECEDGYFGANCSIPCGGCKDGQACEKSDGHCPAGCQTGWTGITCHNVCPDGLFGMNCTFNCGHCKSKGICDKTDGHCEQGCESGWSGSGCTDRGNKATTTIGCVGDSCDKPCETCNATKDCTGDEKGCTGESAKITARQNYVPIVVPVCLIVAVIACVAVIVFFLRRRNDQTPRFRGKDISVVYAVMDDSTDQDVTSDVTEVKTDQPISEDLDTAHEEAFRQCDDTGALIDI